ncbi:MAG TPA: tripartite tricarboxylate transporter substrate-binding protein [Beijerinckiaceae bacterium]|nr:tripartite tricarboxylate transporter substrate-binding protein [Beijerinckiaceae bacterium]
MLTSRSRHRLIFLSAALLAGALAANEAPAQTASTPYAGKQIRMVISSGAGGGIDLYARVLAAHIVDHIPGHPTIVNENMPGAIGMVATNWTYNSAPRDGTAILAGSNAVLAAPLYGDKTAKFDAHQFASIGSIGTMHNVCATWYQSPIKTLDQAKSQTVTVAAAGEGSHSATLPLVLNDMLGTKFKVVFGYSTGEMRLALERGEADGICGLAWSTLKVSNPEWVKDNRLNVLVQTGDDIQPELPNAPLLKNLISDQRNKDILELVDFPQKIGRPFVMPPGTPQADVEVIRSAFDATMRDPAFLADAAKAGLEVDPVSGLDMEKILADAYGASPELIKASAPYSGFGP